MSVTYFAERYIPETKEGIFMVKKNGQMIEHKINMQKENLLDYGSVHPSHYRDEKGNIVIIPYDNRLVHYQDNEMFIKARQWEYDKWCTREFPDSANARLYRIFQKM